MKTLILLVSLFFLCNTSQAMERKTLISNNGDIHHGGMGGVIVKGTNMVNTSQILVGGKGAWLINHQLYIGGSGYGATRELSANNTDYNIGLGGVMMGYFFLPHKLIHFGTEIVVGGGGIAESYMMDDYDSHNHNRGDSLFYAEPSVYASLNILPYAKLNAGVSYRYVLGSDTAGISDEDLRGFNAEVNIMFGKF